MLDKLAAIQTNNTLGLTPTSPNSDCGHAVRLLRQHAEQPDGGGSRVSRSAGELRDGLAPVSRAVRRGMRK
jgi:hypothetical protein